MAAAIKAGITVIVATQHHRVNPGPARKLTGALHASIVELNGGCGHIATGCEAPNVAVAVARTLRWPSDYLDLHDLVLFRLFGLALQRRLKVTNPFAQPFGQFRDFFPPEQQHGDPEDHQQFRETK